jgi:hypothetical protein
MTPVVIDTDAVSFLFKGDSRSQLYLPHLQERQWLVSFMTAAELEQWAFVVELESDKKGLAAIVPGAVRGCSVVARFSAQMGRSDSRQPPSRPTSRNGRCVDRRHCRVVRCAVGNAQSERLPRGRFAEVDLGSIESRRATFVGLIGSLSENQLQRELDGSRAADLVERVETAVRAAGAEAARESLG